MRELNTDLVLSLGSVEVNSLNLLVVMITGQGILKGYS